MASFTYKIIHSKKIEIQVSIKVKFSNTWEAMSTFMHYFSRTAPVSSACLVSNEMLKKVRIV